MDKESEQTSRLEYNAPRLERYATLSALTKARRTFTGDDFVVYKEGFSGSPTTPNPPGPRGPGS